MNTKSLSGIALLMFITLFVMPSFAVIPGTVEGSVERAISYQSPGIFPVPGQEILVILNTRGVDFIVETLPAGSFLVSATQVLYAQPTGNQLTLLRDGRYEAVFYRIRVPVEPGTYLFSGYFRDGDRDVGNVTGVSSFTVQSLVTPTPVPTPAPTSIPTSIGNVMRDIRAVPVNGIVSIILTPSPSSLFDSPGYRVSESIPTGFQFVSTTAASYDVAGDVLTLTQMGSSSIVYRLRAPSSIGSYLLLGVFYDEDRYRGLVEGDTNIVLTVGYDTNGNGRIDRSEAVQAVMDYFSGIITRQEAIDVVMAYFNQ